MSPQVLNAHRSEKGDPATEAFPSWASSIEAEQALLGALLLDNLAFGRIAECVVASDFYTEDHSTIYRGIAALVGRGESADVVTLAAHLLQGNAEAFNAAGGAAYLGTLAQSVPSALNVERYAELVREKALCRRLDAFGLEISRLARASGGRDAAGSIAEARGRLVRLAERAAWKGLRASTADALINLELPELRPLLSPWLFEKNLCMVHAKRGVGKTHFAMGLAFAIAAGAKFLAWQAPQPRPVLYVDGEMPAQLMQQRLRELASGYGEVPQLLRIVTPDQQEKPMPDLATGAGQAELDALIGDETALVVIDNLSCLVRSGGAENESESWGAVSEWALKHRRAGRAILFIHHSGKTGAQRGTSKREDLLDVVINLRRPGEYNEADGAVFDVHFEKARSLTGEDVAPIEARLDQTDRSGYVWTHASAATKTQGRIKALWDGGTLNLHDVMREIGCSKSHAHKTLDAAMAAGELTRPYPQKPRRSSKETK